MKIKFIMTSLFIIYFLMGCMGNSYLKNPNDQALNLAPVCKSKRECDFKWSAARRWVIKNSSTKIQIMTSDYMETYNPRRYSTDIACRVSKEPMVDGGYRFVIDSWCKNLFGCFPSKLEFEDNFNRYINSVVWDDK